jgi:hypothetical protein
MCKKYSFWRDCLDYGLRSAIINKLMMIVVNATGAKSFVLKDYNESKFEIITKKK